MNGFLFAAGILAALLGISHSILGEKLVLRPLLQRSGLPTLLGREDFFKNTLRFTWHITTILLVGMGAVLAIFSFATQFLEVVGFVTNIMAAIFFACFIVALAGSRGRHFSWVVFLLISLLCLASHMLRSR